MELEAEAQRLFRVLKRKQLRIVFAESCTGGLIAATLAQIPKVSEHLCGSWVVYRNDSKNRWLGIPAKLLQTQGAVSAPVASRMALKALQKTPEADVAASITGHLGPNAPKGFDGKAFIAIATRHDPVFLCEIQILSPKITRRNMAAYQRKQRQRVASLAVLFMVRSLLKAATQKERNNGKFRKIECR